MVGQKDSTAHLDLCYIDTLPEEILSNIQAMAAHIQNADKDRYRFPATLCKVSRRWREVACCTPRIWSFVFITGGRNSQHLPTRLGRTGTVPLDIKIEDLDDTINCAAVMDQLLPFSDRWTFLDVKVADLTRYAPHFPKSLPRLRSIKFSDSGIPFNLTTSLPQLEYLSLQRSWFFCDAATTLPSLIDLHVADGDSNDGHQMAVGKLLGHLHNAPSLEILDLTESWFFTALSDEEIQNLRSRAVELPRLRALRVDGLYTWEVVAVLSCIRAKALRSLVLGVRANDISRVPDSLQANQLHLHFPALRMLTLKALRISTDEAMHILSQMPQIQTLSLMRINQKAISLRTLVTHPSLIKLTSHLSELFTCGISLVELHSHFSTLPEFQALGLRLTLKVHESDFVYRGEAKAEHDRLLEAMGILVPGFTRVDREPQWDMV